MKLTITLLMLCSLLLSGKDLYAQKERITLKVKNASVGDILKAIEKQTPYLFFYNHREIGAEEHETLSVESERLDLVLEKLFAGKEISYKVVDSHIVLTPSSQLKSVAKILQSAVSGTVIGSGEPLTGVSVSVKGTNISTVTDQNGRFQIENVAQGATLLFTYVGYMAQEVRVGSTTVIDVTLQEDVQLLEDVVVIGYGTAKKRDLTGAVSSIKAEDLASQGPRNVQDLLRANAPGLNIGVGTDAKAEATLSIRGNGTLTASNSPLIVLDNVIYEGALTDINPNDIATVDILKDASAAAVYGSRSSNGVIVITTKRGKQGKPLINLVSNTGLAQSANQPDILDPEGFLRFRQDYNEGRFSEEYLAQYPQMFVNPNNLSGIDPLAWYNYDQSTPVTSVTQEQLVTKWLSRLNLTSPEIENYFANRITHWDDLIFQTARQQDYSLNISNASEYVSQYFSLGYTDREGVITGDRFKNIRARANVESKITSFLTSGVNMQFASRNEGFLKSDSSQMTMISPYGSNNIGDPNSEFWRRPTGLDPINPFYDNLYTDRVDRRQNVIATLFARVYLPFGIEYNLNFTPRYEWSEYYNHYSSHGDRWASIGGSAEREHTKTFNWQLDNILRWRREFADIHNVEVTLLANAEKGQYWSTTAEAQGFSPSDQLGYHRLQAGSINKVSSEDMYRTGDALMGRLFYSLKGRYMLTASIRRDGYSAFGKRNPRAVFPALALGWTFTDESFIPDVSWLNYGKLRYSWGENGNREIGQYAALAQMASGLVPYIDQSGNVYTTSQIYVETMANYDLKWERSASHNIGLDFGLLSNRVSGSVEAYLATTHDLLVDRLLPDVTGYEKVTSNLGKLQNKGLEVSINAGIIQREQFSWNATANFSLNRRTIKSLYGDMVDVVDASGQVIGQRESDDEVNGWFIGQDPDRIWSYERAGVWQLGEEAEAAKYGLQPGDFKYIDQNGDGLLNNEDKVFQGYKTPRGRLSLRNDLKHKGFALSVMLYSNLNYYGSFQRAANSYSFPDRTSDYAFPRWTSTNPINDYARIGSKNIGTNWVNKSFVRLESVVLSYQFPKDLLLPYKIQGLQLSASVQNAAVFSPRWTFWDPENGFITPRNFNFGVNIIL
ncbi:SusC/RagA family TonB-linked outer membrane protein [Parapedobacter sp. GCM10030251]|uniref:SusC/RagA family TonB-linked outer membrane protein n=1 Tax=Parapedobacter sp. GCM10030251 TaxID=3273419 RepID=UPI00360A5E6A